MSDLKGMLIRHEGMKLKPYQDTQGKMTIGVGRNLDDVGISESEALMLLENDITQVQSHCETAFPWFDGLAQARKDAVVSMVFNLGFSRFIEFRAMIAAIQKQDWDQAASEMLSSRWASQVKGRAVELADMVRTGDFK